MQHTLNPAQMPFSVWSPEATAVTLVVEDHQGHRSEFELLRLPDGPEPEADQTRGWWALPETSRIQTEKVRRYGFIADTLTASEWNLSGKVLPDPRSLRQPEGPHELSAPYDPAAFTWSESNWSGLELPGAVIYELHVGTFTAEGTLDAARHKLPYLAELGVDAVELMPVNGFEGAHNWGYDGVNWFAVDESYGGPAAYQAFVDAAHLLGIGVIQDVVYNHFGPSGNYAPVFGPFLSEVPSPWGTTLNFSGPHSDGIRQYVLDNVRLFLEDYRVDGLRLDAVHAIVDNRATHLLADIRSVSDEIEAASGRKKWLIAESDRNDPATLRNDGYRMHAQWCDDFHHGLHVALTGETDSYYGDFAELDALVKTLNTGFFHDGNYSSFRQRHHGAPLDLEREEPWQLVVSNQTHDQVGNRAAGDRLSALCSDGQLAIAAALTLLGPYTPMLFMGEEFAASTPWQFFTDHQDPVIAEATRAGRFNEFAAMGWDAALVPDPQDHTTRDASVLQEADLASARGQLMFAWYQQLIRLRHEDKNFHVGAFDKHSAELVGERGLALQRRERTVVVNFGEEPLSLPASVLDGRKPILSFADTYAPQTAMLAAHGTVVF
ncbi:malto-oligosyltrehalose trehalohydrolase [Micrococcoides hystricis]|uniref:Malto-oligosyltrehalose trehalohydrolase n=1 Tax=Micrococcoides hystricis TaxID=1572761 RepID=A0ABV6P8Z1_9MICC